MAMFPIERNYIGYGSSRPGIPLSKVRFIVSHDTGNPGSNAIGNRDYFNEIQPKASAHTFIDDKTILEIVPINEVAYHVRYGVSTDNDLYGYDANKAAIGWNFVMAVMLTFGKRIPVLRGIMRIYVKISA